MAASATSTLRGLVDCRLEYGGDASLRKRALLDRLEHEALRGADAVLQLHEVLCFLRAYPDDEVLLDQVERMLDVFEKRRDLRRHAVALADSGVAGTTTTFRFFAATGRWLARRWGDRLTIDWSDFERADRLEGWLPALATYGETPALDEMGFEVREWIDRMKSRKETDAAFLLRRMDQLRLDPHLKDTLLDELDVPTTLAPGSDTPARTREKVAPQRIAFQTAPISRERPAMPAALDERPRATRRLSPAQGREIVGLARAAMVVRSRDLDAFMYGDPKDVRMVAFNDGLAFACIGMRPERRLLLETQYGYVVLKNGVPVGYGTITSLFGSSEVAYTIFDTFRGVEAAAIFVRILTVARHVFGSDAYMIDPYQIGQDNEDAVRSGAWWFYRKLGFAPHDPEVLRVMRAEQRRLRSEPTTRSSAATLRELAGAPVFLHEGKTREDVLGMLPLANIGLQVMAYVGRRFGSDRARAERVCADEASRLLGLSSRGASTPGERVAWRRWAPLVLALPGVARWPARDRRALAAVVRAKGGVRESDYLTRFNAHKRLRRAIRSLAGRRIPDHTPGS